MDTEAVHSVAKASLHAFHGPVHGKAMPCVLLLGITSEWPRFGFPELLVRSTEQLGTCWKQGEQ